MFCTCCHHELTGGLDTFGDRDIPMCWDCYSALLSEWRDSYVPMFECAHGPNGVISCRMTDEWKAIEDGVEAALGAARPAGGQE